MTLRSPSASLPAHRIALFLVALGVPCVPIGLGCADQIESYPPPASGPANGHTGGAIGGTVDAGSDGAAQAALCACVAGFYLDACNTCNLGIIPAGAACNAAENACAASPACTADSACVGACRGDASMPEPACVKACLATATTQYIAYASCVCEHCAMACSVPGGVTCP